MVTHVRPGAQHRTSGALRRVAITPGVMAFLGSARLRDRPHRMLDVLRRVDPVHRSPFGFWVLSGHAEVEAVLRDPRFGTDEAEVDLSLLRLGPLNRAAGAGTARTDGAFLDLAPDLMLFRNPPDHTRLRALVARAFTPRRISEIETRVTEIADDLIDRLPRNREFDLMAELAYPFPARVICELLGLPPEDHTLIATHGRALAVGLDPLPTQAALDGADRAVVALRRHLEPVFADRRRQPRDDLISALVASADDGDRLTASELLATVVLLLIAGHETTANLIGNGIALLDRNPGQRRLLRHGDVDPALAVEELLRHDPPVQMTQRIAGEDADVAGEAVPKGAIVVALIVAANHDPREFDRPERLNLSRSPNRHLTFGAGAHYCLGAALARLEGRIVLPRLLRALPDLHVVRPRPRHRPSFTIRGYERLTVTDSSAAGSP